MRVILASASPRRKELLTLLGFPFEVLASTKDEISHETKPDLYVQDLAKLKGEDILKAHEQSNALIIAADTIVSLDNNILEKPENMDHAKEMLLSLSGKKHQVYTGVWLGKKDRFRCFSCCTEVKFRSIPDDLLSHYLGTKDSLDKSGSYGIQSGALCFIDSIEGCFANVVGLPLSETDKELRDFLGADYQQLKGS